MSPHPPPAKQRRASRGRRSLITIQPDGGSPQTVNAPINGSIQGITTQERIAGVKERIQILQQRKTVLEEEQTDWDAITGKYTEKANRDEGFAPVSESKIDRLVDDCGVRPNYVLSRVFNEFQDSMGNDALKQKNELIKLQNLVREKEEILKRQEQRREHMKAIYKQCDVDDLTKRINFWKDLTTKVTKSHEETRAMIKLLNNW